MQDRASREAALTTAIQREVEGAKCVFDEDGEHVYVGPVVDDDGKTVVKRYRLGGDAQRFLLGEFDELPTEGVPVVLEAPEPEGGD
jgi:hypothetical protein